MVNKQLCIDFHAHILPGVDHGCKDEQEAKKQFQLLRQAGVDIVVSTPHFYPHRERFEGFDKRRKCAWEKEGIWLESVRGSYKENDVKSEGMDRYPQVRLGAEVFVCRGMEHMPELEQLCIDRTKTILLEMPTDRWSPELMETVLEIQYTRGLRVVLAHVERYSPESVQALFDEGIKGQINISTLNSGLFIKRNLKQWIDAGNIVALGSDLHGTDDCRIRFDKVQKRLKGQFADIMRQTAGFL